MLSCNYEREIKREQERQIDEDIRNDEVVKRIQSMQHSRMLRHGACDSKKQRCGKYNQAASLINLIQDPSDYESAENIDNANIRFQNIHNEFPELENQCSDSRIEDKTISYYVHELRNESSSL